MNTLKLHPGARVGAFEILAPLGAGSQAWIFLARPWEPLARRLWSMLCGVTGSEPAPTCYPAVLKVARPGYAAALHDEHGYLARPAMVYPGLPRLYCSPKLSQQYNLGLVKVGNMTLPFLALTYLPGIDLARLLARRRRPLTPSLAVAIALKAATALEHLHERIGLIHHDVKPANLLIAYEAQRSLCVTLIDLGAAEVPAAPRRRWIYGSGIYLPPEVDHVPPGPHVDIYALGQLLLTMIGAGQASQSALSTSIVSPSLAALLAAATDQDIARRHGALPRMIDLRERLAATPEARHL